MADPNDPRFIRSREAMLAAACQLLQDEGPAAVTHQRIAQQADVGRATVYRHWSDAADLLKDAVSVTDVPFFRQPRLPLRPWLLAELRSFADELALPEMSSVAISLMDNQIKLLDQRLQAAFTLAADAGELDQLLTPEALTALLLGPMIFCVTLQDAAVPDALLERLV